VKCVKKFICFVLTIASIFVIEAQTDPLLHTWRAEITVVDENSQPVSGADVSVGYSSSEWPEPVFGYFIRVRTQLDEQGNVKSALYGKIPGNFRFYAGTKAPRAGMGFDYYLNPTPNDRNVEFDPKQNLLKGIKSFERVREP
jgi:hypothetical protein